MDARLVVALSDQYGRRGHAVGGWLGTLKEEEVAKLSYRDIECLLAALDDDRTIALERDVERRAWASVAEALEIPHAERLITWLWYADGGTPGNE